MPSHLFVAQADITHLACDAWLLPTDSRVTITGQWREMLPQLSRWIDDSDTAALRSGARLTAEMRCTGQTPVPVLTAVPQAGFEHPDELRPAIREFIKVGSEIAKRQRDEKAGTFGRRPNPLLAMPSFGSKGGGGGFRRGQLLHALMDEASDAARDEEVDVVLVFRNSKSYALAQQIRQQSHDGWSELPSALRDRAVRLAKLAAAGRLVPFMGAGVSVTAGAPTWKSLIKHLAAAVGLSEDERESLLEKGRSPLDQAAYLRSAFLVRPVTSDQDGGFTAQIITAVDVQRYGLAPALLASIPSEQAITLNYDRLFEMASEDAGRPRRVIPGGLTSTENWLLKLHGSVDQPASIVLTRDDYLGFSSERAALSALVKATLMTRHLLFVGFGLSDDHFHEIVHDVRRAMLGQPEARRIGTALTLHQDRLDEALWQSDLEFIAMPGGGTVLERARLLEIFLDALLAFASLSQSYLLADGFEDGLDESERELRGALLTLLEGLPEHVRTSPAGKKVATLLGEFGLDNVQLLPKGFDLGDFPGLSSALG